MTDRQRILDQLARMQCELATIKLDIENPDLACDNYGLSGDFCLIFKSNLEKEAIQAEVNIATLHQYLYIYDWLVGKWTINVQDQLGDYKGELNIVSLDACRTFLGNIVLTDRSHTITIKGSYNDLEHEINFTSFLHEEPVQQYLGIVNCSDPPTMQGAMKHSIQSHEESELLPKASWSAQKQ